MKIKVIHMAIFLCVISGASVLGGCSSSIGVANKFAAGDTAIASSVGSGEVGSGEVGSGEVGRTGTDSTGKLITTSAKLDDITRRKDLKQQTVYAKNVTGAAYFIGVQDVVEVSVFRVADLSKTVQVSDTGTINLPLIGTIKAAGKTARQVEQELTKKLGAKYLQNPQVNVYVKEFNSQKVTINGDVKKPGVFSIRGKTTLVSTLAMAGGFKDSADSTVVLFRMRAGKQQAARFNISAIQAGTATDPVVQAGDRVFVGRSIIQQTFNNVLKALPIIGKFALL